MAKKFDFLSPGVEIREIDQSFIPQEAEAEGPIIIGRSRKGPANKPVKIRNLDDFVSVFGLPVPGGAGQGDVWRDGNTAGTTYASYAAQAWLASENSPITFVRLAGEGTSGALAGWQVGNDGIGSTGDNSTAYGLFLCDDTDAAQASSLAITLDGGVTVNTDLDSTIITIKRAGSAVATVEFSSSDAGLSTTVANTTEITVGTSGLTTAAKFLEALAVALHTTYSEDLFSKPSVAASSTNITLFNVDSGAGNTLQLLSDTASKLNGGSDLNNYVASNIIALATTGVSDGALAAVLYCTTGALGLSGTTIDAATPGYAGTLIKSNDTSSGFSLVVYDSAGVTDATIPFNFDRASEKYIRNVLNTNPHLTNSTTIASSALKTYWLGETFKDHVDNFVSKTTTGNVYGILLPLGVGVGASANWGYQRKDAAEAKSGWVIAQKPNEEDLFRFKCLHVGEDIQKNYLIAIEDLALPSNPSKYNYGTFTVAFKTIDGTTVERYNGCNLDPNSANYVAKRIGDQFLEWDSTNKRYRTKGEYQNQSNLFYIEVNDSVDTQGLLPLGFRGPVRPKGFSLLQGHTVAKSLDGGSDFTGSVVQSGDDSVVYKGHLAAGASTSGGDFADLDTVEQVRFVFPKLRLRVNGTEGGAPNPARSYWGVRPKISATSTQNDPDFCDYLRGITEGLGGDSHVASGDFEYSFTFRMQDLVETAGAWSWAEGNYNASTSKSVATLISDGARQFVMPVWGGFDGFDITEMEPMRNSLLESNTSETDHYTRYTINKAIDSVSDPEVVPANLLLAPGFYDNTVTNKLINTAEMRKDVLAIIDLSGDYEPRFEALEYSLGSVTSAVSDIKSRNLDSSYACAFYPWVQVSDNLNGGQLAWMPPSVAALGAFGRSQAQSELWFAPAGFNRGGLGSLGGPRGPKVLQARQRLDSKERDLLYEVNINPIATFPAEGVVIFGQKTLQSGQSALDRINVRRLVLYLKSEVSRISRNLLFDQNLSTTWNRFKSQVDPIMSSTKSRFGLSDYRIILDDTTTTADLIDRNIMYAKIYIKPARAIEYIAVDFVITRTGADFV